MNITFATIKNINNDWLDKKAGYVFKINNESTWVDNVQVAVITNEVNIAKLRAILLSNILFNHSFIVCMYVHIFERKVFGKIRILK